MDSIQEISTEIFGKLQSWWETTLLMLPNFIMAILVIVGFVLLGKLVKKGVRKLMRQITDNLAISNLMSAIAYVAIITVGAFFALGVLDLDKTVTSLLAGVGVIGLALSFAFQNTATNFISGILMASKYPLNVGDLVETQGHFGIVKQIGLRYTTIDSFQGQLIVIPNKEILENSLVNYSISNQRRVDLSCGVGYGEDLQRVEEVAVNAIQHLSESDDPVEVMYNEFGDSSINFTMRFWLKNSKNKNYLLAKSHAVKALKKAFDEKGINIPFPIRTLEFRPKQLEQMVSKMEVSQSSSDHSSQNSK